MVRLLFSLLILLPVSLFAQSTDDQSNLNAAKEIYTEFLSPYCPGRALADCPSKQAQLLKNEILEDLISGQSKEFVLSSLADEFGAEYNSKPALAGFAGLAWLVPVFFLLIGLSVGILWFRKQRS